MSLFQCEGCGCVENTATSAGYWLCRSKQGEHFDWTGKEHFKGKRLCCVCMPEKYNDGTKNEGAGVWHNRFPRKFLPLGMFITNRVGNLEHKETGEEDYRPYILPEPALQTGDKNDTRES